MVAHGEHMHAKSGPSQNLPPADQLRGRYLVVPHATQCDFLGRQNEALLLQG